jgi:hypothetical protein
MNDSTINMRRRLKVKRFPETGSLGFSAKGEDTMARRWAHWFLSGALPGNERECDNRWNFVMSFLKNSGPRRRSQVGPRICQLADDLWMPLTIADAAFGQAFLASWRILMPSNGLQVISHVVVSSWR